MDYDVIPTVALSVVVVFAIHGITIYSITKMLVSGRTLVERKEAEPEQDRATRIVRMDR